jgi:hypothetical protein
MMKLLFLTFFGFLASVFVPQDQNVKELRRLMNEGKDSKSAAAQLYEKVGEYAGSDPLLLGYKASAYAFRAKYSSNPLKKLKSIKTSSRIFTDAVAKDGNNLELRFMRYAVEVNTPKSLDLSAHVNEDKGILIEALRKYPKSGFTPETATIARDFLKQNCSCSEEEKQVLENVKI